MTSWTNWESSTLTDDDIVDSESRYMTRDKVYDWFDTDTKSGWTSTGKSDIVWGTWSSWSRTAVSASALEQVEARDIMKTQYRYHHYTFKNSSGSYQVSPIQEYTENWRAYSHHYTSWLDSKLSLSGTSVTARNGTWDKYDHNCSSCEFNSFYGETSDGTPYTRELVDYTEYRYRNGSYIYEFWKWAEWPASCTDGIYSGSTTDKEIKQEYRYLKESDEYSEWGSWQDTPIEKIANNEVQTRKLYKYIIE